MQSPQEEDQLDGIYAAGRAVLLKELLLVFLATDEGKEFNEKMLMKAGIAHGSMAYTLPYDSVSSGHPLPTGFLQDSLGILKDFARLSERPSPTGFLEDN